jgi:hypothetical protein
MTHTASGNGAQHAIHDEAGNLLATIEHKIDGYHVLIRDRDVACVGTREAALAIAHDPQNHGATARANERAGSDRLSRGPKSYRRRNRIGEQFAPRTIRMLESPAYRVLSLSAHRLLSRIEIEMAQHGGYENGNLPVTFDQFEEYGIHRHAVAPAIRECCALGFLEVTERGQAGNREFRQPSKYRLTYRDTNRARPTHEWARIETREQAEALVRAARKSVAEARAKKHFSSGGKRHAPVAESTTGNTGFPVAESTTTVPVAESTTTSRISGEEAKRTRAQPCSRSPTHEVHTDHSGNGQRRTRRASHVHRLTAIGIG